MNPTIPTQAPRKSSGCAKFILFLGLAFAFLLVSLAILGAILDNTVRKDAIQSSDRVIQDTDEPARHETNVFQPHNVPSNIVRLSQKELGERYKDSSATSDGEAWTIWIRADVGSYADHPEMLQHEMIRLASACHPNGMKVAKFSVIYNDDFTDGLGNISDRKLLQCKMMESVSGKINWGNRQDDLYLLHFSRMFDTEFCHTAYKAKWEASLNK